LDQRTTIIFTTQDRRNPQAWREWASAARRQYAPGEAIVVDVNRVGNLRTYLRYYTNINDVVIIGHSSSRGVYVGADGVRGTNISDAVGRNNARPRSINWGNVEGKIRLWGCNAGRGENPIARSIANESRRPVEAYSNYVNIGSGGPTVFTKGNTWDIIRGDQSQFGGRVEFEPETRSGGGGW
jgi:hypothetical protein